MGCGACGKMQKLERFEQKYSRYGSGLKNIDDRPQLIQFLIKLFDWILKFFMGILIFVIFVIVLIPFLVWIVIRLTLGKEILVDIPNMVKKTLNREKINGK